MLLLIQFWYRCVCQIARLVQHFAFCRNRLIKVKPLKCLVDAAVGYARLHFHNWLSIRQNVLLWFLSLVFLLLLLLFGGIKRIVSNLRRKLVLLTLEQQLVVERQRVWIYPCFFDIRLYDKIVEVVEAGIRVWYAIHQLPAFIAIFWKQQLVKVFIDHMAVDLILLAAMLAGVTICDGWDLSLSRSEIDNDPVELGNAIQVETRLPDKAERGSAKLLETIVSKIAACHQLVITAKRVLGKCDRQRHIKLLEWIAEVIRVMREGGFLFGLNVCHFVFVGIQLPSPSEVGL